MFGGWVTEGEVSGASVSGGTVSDGSVSEGSVCGCWVMGKSVWDDDPVAEGGV